MVQQVLRSAILVVFLIPSVILTSNARSFNSENLGLTCDQKSEYFHLINDQIEIEKSRIQVSLLNNSKGTSKNDYINRISISNHKMVNNTPVFLDVNHFKSQDFTHIKLSRFRRIDPYANII